MLRQRLTMVLLATAIAVLAGGVVFFAVPPQQQSNASVLFVPSSKQPGVEGETNPLLSLGGSVAVVANVVQLAVTDDQTAQSLTNAGHMSKYEVVPDLTENAGPVLLVTTTGTSASDAVQTRDSVVAAIGSQLQRLQDERSVPTNLRVTSVLLTSTTKVTIIHKTQIQFAVVTSAVIWIILVLLILLRERHGQRRPKPRPHTPTQTGTQAGEVAVPAAEPELADTPEEGRRADRPAAARRTPRPLTGRRPIVRTPSEDRDHPTGGSATDPGSCEVEVRAVDDPESLRVQS